ncbi:alpha/beta hydrolase [Deinococcus deserti]|uniref:Putative Alpha/beta hydrolase fold protein n=1 Tax=Deinococcus deserti (strain DSM 17065 / CIP 109153 / LMG 22923 / VCD115) TaxID=546414 RepID=C1CW70_DEIDV|nr:alpha/beta hydrolase [Deinococcus deserti]ACO46437.1 putative Alpha/beta hydrolase fold protein [Deinococcus deserti VCD115]
MPETLITEQSLHQGTLVALHGNLASSAWWASLLAEPPVGWRVLAPDLPGFAGSAHMGEVSISAYATWLRDWLANHLDPGECPVLLGHSLGGAVALEYAARQPAEISGLALAASAPLDGLITPEEHYPLLELLREDKFLLEMHIGALFPSQQPANFTQLVHDASRMARTHYSGNARALSTWKVDPAALAGLPVLVLGGELDRLTTPDMVHAQAAALGCRATILSGLGHGFPQEDALAFLQHLQPFLNQLPNDRLDSYVTLETT